MSFRSAQYDLQHVVVSLVSVHMEPAHNAPLLLESLVKEGKHAESVLHLARATQHVAVSAMAVHGLALHS
jgi:hypothetical protein